MFVGRVLLRLSILCVGSAWLSGCASNQTGSSLPPLIQLTSTVTSEFVLLSTPLPSQEATRVIPSPSATLTPKPTPVVYDLFTFDNPVSCQDSWCVYSFYSPFQRPILSMDNDRVDPAYRYGATQEGLRKVHKGVEFVNPAGTSVFSIGNGTVIIAETDHYIRYGPVIDFYGNVIIIEHNTSPGDPPIYSLYAHLSEILVRSGQLVNSGDLIGRVGATGSALGSHLHLEIRYGENNYVSTVNPELVLPPPVDPESGSQTGVLVLKLHSDNYSIFSIPMWVKNISDNSMSPVFLESYFNRAPRTTYWQEVGTIGDLVEGQYLISFYKNGLLFETTFPIYSGKMTVIDFSF